MVFVTLDYVDQSLVGFFSRWEIILRIGERIVEVKVVDIHCDSFELRIAPFERTQPLIVEHGLSESEIACV